MASDLEKQKALVTTIDAEKKDILAEQVCVGSRLVHWYSDMYNQSVIL